MIPGVPLPPRPLDRQPVSGGHATTETDGRIRIAGENASGTSRDPDANQRERAKSKTERWKFSF